MRFFLLLLLLPMLVRAQSESDGGEFCRLGKIRYAERLAANSKARVAYPGDASIDVTFYGLDLRLTHTPNSLRGAVTITLKSTTAGLSSFYLDLSSTTLTTGQGLRVDSVVSNGRQLPFQHAQNRLTITPTQSLAVGQALTLTVFYQGVPYSRDLGSFRFSRHEGTNDPVIWSLSEPYGAPDWFPCKDTPADKADSSTVRITASPPFVSVSNGVLVSTTDNPDGTRTVFWRNSYPIAHYLISIAMSNYERYETPFTYQGRTLPITHYVYPETLPQVKPALDLTPGIMQVFTNRFGPYPFLREKYGHAQIGQDVGGMEHQTISSMSGNAFTDAVIAHELGHQWFGDKITCRDWQNIWLNEGFASYAEAVYAESVGGRTGYLSKMNGFLLRARSARGCLYVHDISNFGNIFDGNRTYAKGATVLHMLRGIVGDSTFFRILRTYAATPTLAYQTAVTEDFQAVAEEVSGQSLAYFFRQWVYGEGYPTYSATVSGGTTSRTAQVRLQQRNVTATNPTSFTMPVQLQIRSAAGDTTVTVFNNQADQVFTVPTKGPVTGVIVDPNSWLLRLVTSEEVVTSVAEPRPISLRVYPNPVTEAINVTFTANAPGAATLSLINLAGQRVRFITEPVPTAGDYTRMVDLRGLSAGRYMLTVTTADGPQSRVVLVH